MISCVITTYNRDVKTLSKSVNSVINQTYKDIELIIVDDNGLIRSSELGISAYIEKQNIPNLVYIQNQKNLGAQKSRNLGIENAKGDYIAFLDDDDEWLKTKLEKQLKKFCGNVGLVFCDSNIIYLDENDNIVKTKIRSDKIPKKPFEGLLFKNYIGPTSFPLIKKSVFEKVGKFNVSLKASQDYELWLRIVKVFDVSKVNTPLVNYFVHKHDKISSDLSKKIEARETVDEINKDYIHKNKKLRSHRQLRTLPILKKQRGLIFALKTWFLITIKNPIYFGNYKYFVKLIIRNDIE